MEREAGKMPAMMPAMMPAQDLILALSLLATAPTPPPPLPPLAITHVTVIDAGTPKPRTDMTVITSGTRIVAIGATGQVTVPRGARVIDGSKKFLIPGLWDMHVHL